MLSTTLSYGLSGIDGLQITVEVNVSNGLPMFEIVGLPDAAVKESRERIRAALKNCSFPFPDDRITVNLAPADIKKEGPAFDLPIAVAILACQKRVNPMTIKDMAILGELALDGSVRSVRGVLPMAISAHDHGVKEMIVPYKNMEEVACVTGVTFYPAKTLTDVVKHLSGEKPIPPVEAKEFSQLIEKREYSSDFRYVKGQRSAKRALEIAAAGGHNVLMVGPPGSGKTLMARCVPSILPDMTFEEALVTTRIHSVAGSMPDTGLMTERPFRSPHHTASHVSLVGGGIHAVPGEISKAHNGVLFLDELPEYRRDVLEALRQPMEDGFVTITRVSAQSTYPSEFMLVCSMNPCPCGHYGSKTHECRCTPNDIRKYLSRISGPLLDRIDMHIEVESIPAERLSDEMESEPSAAIHARVEEARNVQRTRYEGLPLACNARLNSKTIQKFCPMEKDAKEMLNLATQSMGLSNRAYTRVIKVARTIADLDHSDKITSSHIAEALQYRAIDDKYWR